MKRRKVILVTDGDCVAQRAVEVATRNLGGRCISLSACQKKPFSGDELIQMILETPHDPVVVMADDRGESDRGSGEEVVAQIAHHPDLEVIGAVAVASNTSRVQGVPVTASVAQDGTVIERAVDKDGLPGPSTDGRLRGDTVDVLNELNLPVIVGLGDPGKMAYADDAEAGAPITTKALRLVMELAGEKVPQSAQFDRA